MKKTEATVTSWIHIATIWRPLDWTPWFYYLHHPPVWILFLSEQESLGWIAWAWHIIAKWLKRSKLAELTLCPAFNRYLWPEWSFRLGTEVGRSLQWVKDYSLGHQIHLYFPHGRKPHRQVHRCEPQFRAPYPSSSPYQEWSGSGSLAILGSLSEMPNLFHPKLTDSKTHILTSLPSDSCERPCPNSATLLQGDVPVSTPSSLASQWGKKAPFPVLGLGGLKPRAAPTSCSKDRRTIWMGVGGRLLSCQHFQEVQTLAYSPCDPLMNLRVLEELFLTAWPGGDKHTIWKEISE